MKRYFTYISTMLLCMLLTSFFFFDSKGFSYVHAASPNDLASYVNPLMGTQGQGNTFPGATSPFGMVQWSPDTDTVVPRKNRPQSGYYYTDHYIRGFGLTHVSGAGCKIGADIPFLPFVGPITVSPGTNSATYASTFSHTNEVATAGYYSVLLDQPGVKTELTVTPHTGFGQFTYPASTASTMIINTGGSLNKDKNDSVLIDPVNNVVSGWAVSGNFCGQGNYYTIYFYAQFNVPFTSYGTWLGANVNNGSISSTGSQAGAYVTFDTTRSNVVQVKVGISYVSMQNALLNVQTENAGWNFSGMVAANVANWDTALNQIQVSGGTTSDMQVFYTSLYHALLFPSTFSDVNGQYIGFDNQIYALPRGHVQYANYSGWDIYRTQIPLIAMLFPNQVSDMMQSLVNDYEQSGCLPKWPAANTNTIVMDGDSADAIIAGAYAFGATNFDTATALQAMLKGANQPCNVKGYVERQGIKDYLMYNYLPVKAPGVVGVASATLEYSADDFAISRFAQALGDTSDFQTFSQRAQNWQNVYNSATGFIQPRNIDGTFLTPFAPTSMRGFDEGDAYQYSWMIPYNLNGLFTDMGGSTAVIPRLNSFFTQLNVNPKSRYAYLGNEPSLTSVWDYDYVQEPWQTQEVVRQAITTLYSPIPGGMPGNDDLGTMGAFVVWSAIGLYPQYSGLGDLVLGSPLFPQITITMGNGTTLQITAQNASDTTPYVQSLLVNGQPSTQLWEPISTLANNATLQFTLDSVPNTSWGINVSDAPPSFASGQ